jgi:predicted ribosome quality control (RQC) complex YloA/Tae2 family protein
MHFDALTLACVTAELQQTVAGGRVQNVLLPDSHSVGLEIYARHERHYLLLSAQPGAGRIHLVQSKLRRGVERETPLLLRLRKLARDALLVAVEQPDPTERLLRLTLHHAEHGATYLVAEPMGRLNNLLLLDQARIILECMQRVPAGEHAQRVLLPGKPYAPPPPQAKLPPLDDGSPDYYARLAAACAAPGKLWKALVAQIAGVSPTQGRELAWRVTGDAEADTSGVEVLPLAQALQELWSPVRGAAWAPGVILEHDAVVGVAPNTRQLRGQ